VIAFDWFTKSEQEAIRRSVPWTRRVADRKTTREGRKIGLLDFIRRNRSRLVLKPNDDYGGHGVHFGAQLGVREWDNAIQTALFSRLHRAGCARFAPGTVSSFQRDGLEIAADVC